MTLFPIIQLEMINFIISYT